MIFNNRLTRRNKLELRIKHLEETLTKYDNRLWMLENPPKFKNGDMVYYSYHDYNRQKDIVENKNPGCKVLGSPTLYIYENVLGQTIIETWEYQLDTGNGVVKADENDLTLKT